MGCAASSQPAERASSSKAATNPVEETPAVEDHQKQAALEVTGLSDATEMTKATVAAGAQNPVNESHAGAKANYECGSPSERDDGGSRDAGDRGAGRTTDQESGEHALQEIGQQSTVRPPLESEPHSMQPQTK